MVACTVLFELEMRYMDSMTRPQLVESVRASSDCLPTDLQEGVAEHSTERLRLLLFAARLIHALRLTRRKPEALPCAE